MVGLRAMVLGRLGRTENSPSKSVCSILPIVRLLGAGVSGTLHPALYSTISLEEAPVGSEFPILPRPGFFLCTLLGVRREAAYIRQTRV